MSSSISQNVSIRQNFHKDSESLINDLINMSLELGYTCKSMAYYFDRDDIGLYGMSDFNRWCAREAFATARYLMDYIVVRGGRVQFETIKKPDTEEWGSPLESLQSLLKYKQKLNALVLKVHDSATDNHDPHLNDFIESEILKPLVSFIRKIGVLISNLKRAGPNLGEYQFNKDLNQYLKDFMKTSSVPVVSKITKMRHLPTVGPNPFTNITFKDLMPVVQDIIQNMNQPSQSTFKQC